MNTYNKIRYTLLLLALTSTIVCAVFAHRQPLPKNVTATVSAIYGGSKVQKYVCDDGENNLTRNSDHPTAPGAWVDADGDVVGEPVEVSLEIDDNGDFVQPDLTPSGGKKDRCLLDWRLETTYEVDVDVSLEGYETTRLIVPIADPAELPKLGGPIAVYTYKGKIQATDKKDIGLIVGAIVSGILLFIIFCGGIFQPMGKQPALETESNEDVADYK